MKPGDEAEIFMETYPGRIIKCTVDSILWATAQGQMPINGNLPNTQPISAPEQRIAVRLLLAGKDRGLFLAAGARGSIACCRPHRGGVALSANRDEGLGRAAGTGN